MSLVLDGIGRSFGNVTFIHPTSLSFARGSLNVLLGATLAGKTSLMRLMAGLDAPTSGKILVDGKDVTGLKVQKRNVAMVYQQFINYPALSVYENIASPLRIAGLSRADIDKKVMNAAQLLKLTPYLQRTPLSLSGGQQQRTAIARALVKGADLVLMDEPLANLDYKLREELRAEIPKIFEASGAIFVYATTEPEEALLLGGNTATLSEGRVTQFGPTPDVYRMPADATTARVFSDPPMNFISVTKRGGHIHFGNAAKVAASGTFANLPDGNYQAGFRANHLDLHQQSPNAFEIQCTLSVTEITGSETFLHLTQGENRWVGLVHGVHHLASGATVPVWLDPVHIYLFSEAGALAAPAAYAMAA